MSNPPIIYNASLATQVLDLFEEVVTEIEPDLHVFFEELSAEPGTLPRLMVQLLESDGEEVRYISGERLCPLPLALTLRIGSEDEQDRLDAAKLLSLIAERFIQKCAVLDGYVAYTMPRSSVVVCLGRTDIFEDWQVTFELKYKQLTKGY